MQYRRLTLRVGEVQNKSPFVFTVFLGGLLLNYLCGCTGTVWDLEDQLGGLSPPQSGGSGLLPQGDHWLMGD